MCYIILTKHPQEATTMTIKLLHNHYDEKKLQAVIEEMKVLGAPVIHAIYDGEIYAALEGCHRLRAAHALGLTPEIIEVTETDTITMQLDGEDCVVSYEDACDMAFNPREYMRLYFEDED